MSYYDPVPNPVVTIQYRIWETDVYLTASRPLSALFCTSVILKVKLARLTASKIKRIENYSPFPCITFLFRFGHKKEKHTGAVEIFPCPDCGKNFSRKSNLKVRFNQSKSQYFEVRFSTECFQAHRDSLHFGKKFPCSFCERIFTNRSSMNQHIKKTHSDPVIGL